jgi:hypothetical protein
MSPATNAPGKPLFRKSEIICFTFYAQINIWMSARAAITTGQSNHPETVACSYSRFMESDAFASFPTMVYMSNSATSGAVGGPLPCKALNLVAWV